MPSPEAIARASLTASPSCLSGPCGTMTVAVGSRSGTRTEDGLLAGAFALHRRDPDLRRRMHFGRQLAFDGFLEFPDGFEQFAILGIPQTAAVQIDADFADRCH